MLALLFAGSVHAAYEPPESARKTYDLNIGWRFIKQDVPGSQNPAFDDAAWQVVSTPHTYNDVDTFHTIISHGGGEPGTYKGLAWYRKHFKLPADLAGRKSSSNLKACARPGEIFLNGKEVGLYENGVTAYGIDITDAVTFRRRRKTSSPSESITAPTT